jgi:HEAT repeat protein
VIKKRLFIGLVVLAGCLLAGLTVTWWRPEVRYYQGKPLKTWTLQAQRGDPRAQEALKALGAKAVPSLVELLQAQDSALWKRLWAYVPKLPPKLRKVAIERIGPPDAARTREAAAYSLGVIGPDARAAAPLLAHALRDKETLVRWAAATALGNIGPGAVPDLIPALGDTITDVRYAGAFVLGQIGPAAFPAVPTLARRLTDTNEGVRAIAASSLSKIGPPTLLALADEFNSGEAPARQTAARRLSETYLALRPVASALTNMVNDPSPIVRLHVTESLSAFGSSYAVALRSLIGALQDPNVQTRLAAVKTLEVAGGQVRRAVPALSERLNDDSPEVRAAAKEALDKIREANPP